MLRYTLLLLTSVVLYACPANAQEPYPSQPVRIINSFPAGGGTDLVVRIVAEAMREFLGQAVIVENKPGANTVIALEEVYKAKPDGYTVFASNSTGTSALLLMKDKLSFDPDQKMTMIAPLADGPPSMGVAHKEAPFSTFQEMVDYAKANPGKVRYASPGLNSGPHLDVELLAKKLGVTLLHIPQKGAGPMVQAVLNGDVHTGAINIGSIGPQIKSGDVKAIHANFPKRLRDYPNIPTLAELGHPEHGIVLWHALWVRADTPKDIQLKLFDAVQKAMKTKKAQDLFDKSEIIAADLKSFDDIGAWQKERVERIRSHAVQMGLLKE